MMGYLGFLQYAFSLIISKEVMLTFLGAILSFIFIVWMEHKRLPKLIIRISYPKSEVKSLYEVSSGIVLINYQSLKIDIINEKLDIFLSWWLTRYDAVNCRGVITFYDEQGMNIINELMQVRWIDTSQPMPLTGSCDGKKINIFDIDRLIPQTTMNIIPGERKTIDVAVKIENEDECYGFCNENYLFSQNMLRYPKWKLNKGAYLIKVDISSSTGGICEIFRIINNGRDMDFKLKQALPEDRKKLSSVG